MITLVLNANRTFECKIHWNFFIMSTNPHRSSSSQLSILNSLLQENFASCVTVGFLHSTVRLLHNSILGLVLLCCCHPESFHTQQARPPLPPEALSPVWTVHCLQTTPASGGLSFKKVLGLKPQRRSVSSLITCQEIIKIVPWLEHQQFPPFDHVLNPDTS